MIQIILQKEEADIVQRLLDLILEDEAASRTVFRDGAERRAALRTSKKLRWAAATIEAA